MGVMPGRAAGHPAPPVKGTARARRWRGGRGRISGLAGRLRAPRPHGGAGPSRVPARETVWGATGFERALAGEGQGAWAYPAGNSPTVRDPCRPGAQSPEAQTLGGVPLPCPGAHLTWGRRAAGNSGWSELTKAKPRGYSKRATPEAELPPHDAAGGRGRPSAHRFGGGRRPSEPPEGRAGAAGPTPALAPPAFARTPPRGG